MKRLDRNLMVRTEDGYLTCNFDEVLQRYSVKSHEQDRSHFHFQARFGDLLLEENGRTYPSGSNGSVQTRREVSDIERKCNVAGQR